MRLSLTESLFLLVPLALQAASLASSLCSEPFYCAVLNPNGGRAPGGRQATGASKNSAPSSSKTAICDEVGIGAPCRLYEELNDHCKRQPGQEPGKGKRHRPLNMRQPLTGARSLKARAHCKQASVVLKPQDKFNCISCFPLLFSVFNVL